MPISKKELTEGFRQTGAKDGDVIMVHSSYKSLGGVEGGADTVIDALKELVGAEGTVLFPTFDFHCWTEGHYFDIKETRSKMGIITELARRRREAMRTPHPIYSFAVIGKLKEEFAQCDDKEGFGKGSALALFHKHNGIVISVGVDDLNNTFTITHYTEYITGCGYRRVKDFSGIYVGRDGNPQCKTYSMFVRAENIVTDMAPALTELIEKDVIKKTHIGRTEILYTLMDDFIHSMADIVQYNPEKLRKIITPLF